MEKKTTVKDILKRLKTGEFFGACPIPMGYTAGLPVLQERNNSLCMMIPYLKYQATGERDKTLVFPIRYTVTIALPQEKAVEYKDLAYEKGFGKVDFSKPIGMFRHEAIRHLNKKEYESARDELYSQYDKVIGTLLFEEDYTEEDEERMRELMQMLMEPCLKPIYERLDADFYHKYLV